MKITRELKDYEIVTALVAGQIMAGVIAAGKDDDETDVVNLAEDIVGEVYSRAPSEE